MNNNINKYTQALLAPANRPFLLIAGAVVISVIVGFIAFYSLTSSNETGPRGALRAVPGDSKVDIGAEKPEAYVEAIEAKNKQNYQETITQPNGVHIPFIIDGKQPEPVGGVDTNIATCGCTMSDAEFHARLSRAGVDFENANDLITQVGGSDIYIAADRYMVSQNKQKLRLLGQDVKLADNGQLVWSDSQPVALPGNGAVFLSVDGEVIDNETNLIPMRGQLLTTDGIVYLANGRYAYRSGNMHQVENTDVFLTSESQLVTVDARPIRHSGNFVFRNRERELTDSRGVPARWENAVVFHSNVGHFVDNKGKIFEKPGILFSYNGIMIDNLGMLTEPLTNLRRLGESDILLDDNGNLKDRFSGVITFYGESVRIGIGQRLILGSGSVTNHNASEVLIEDDGRLTVDVGKGGVQSGLLKDSRGVAFDRFGHLVSRPGKLSQKGLSDVYLTSDGLLTASNGKPLLFIRKDIFLDFNKYLPNNLIGLRTFENTDVTDMDGNQLYLNDAGQFVTRENELANIGVSIVSGDGVVVAASGELMLDRNARKPVVAKNGKPLLYRGKQVNEGADGQLFDADGNPVWDENGGPLKLNEQGFIVNENGELSSLEGFSTVEGKVHIAKEAFGVIDPLLDANGNQIFRNGKPVYKKGNMLLDESGRPLRDESGSLLTIGDDGTVRNQFGVEDEALNSQFSGVISEPMTANGETIYFDSKKVYRRADGALVTDDGQLVTTKDGKPVYMDANGQPVDAKGQKIVEPIFTDEKGNSVPDKSIDAAKVSVLSPLTADGVPILFNGQKVFRRSDGALVTENGQLVKTKDGKTIYMDASGKPTDKSGKPIREAIFTNTTGSPIANDKLDVPAMAKEIVTLNSKPLSYEGKQVYRRADGALVYADGAPVKGKDGQPLYLDKQMNLVSKNGQKANSPWASDNLGTVTNGGFKSINPLGKTYDSGFIKTPDSYVLDKNGKPITYKGKSIKVGDDGRIYDQEGNLVTDSHGNPLYMNDKGEIISENGQPLKEALFADGDGTLLFGDGKPVTSAMKRIGDSDMYITRDGKLLDKIGRPYTHNGKAISIDPATGQLINEDGKPVRDPRGNTMYVSETGEFITKDGKTAKGFVPANSEGVALGADGKLLAGSASLTKISGTNMYRAADGLLVDENGHPIKMDGEYVYLDDKNQLVDRLGRSIRYKGQRLRLNAEGQLVGANGEELVVGKQAVSLDNIGVLSENKPEKQAEMAVSPPALPGDRYPQTNNESEDNAQTEPDSVKGDEKSQPVNTDGKIKLSLADENARARFAQRLKSRMLAMAETTSEYQTDIFPTYTPTTDVLSALVIEQKDNVVGPKELQSGDESKGKNIAGRIVEPTGSTFFVVSTHALNTDFNDRLEVEIHMQFPDHPMHLAKAYAKIELVYDNAVLKFYEICPQTLDCFGVEGIAMDPVTASAGMAVDVDNHYWYRLGGVFLAAFGTGIADGVANSQDRTQITDNTPGTSQTTTIIEGLSYPEIALQGLGEAGRAFFPTLAERMNRPVTVKIPKGTEMVMKIFDHITEDEISVGK